MDTKFNTLEDIEKYYYVFFNTNDYFHKSFILDLYNQKYNDVSNQFIFSLLKNNPKYIKIYADYLYYAKDLKNKAKTIYEYGVLINDFETCISYAKLNFKLFNNNDNFFYLEIAKNVISKVELIAYNENLILNNYISELINSINNKYKLFITNNNDFKLSTNQLNGYNKKWQNIIKNSNHC